MYSYGMVGYIQLKSIVSQLQYCDSDSDTSTAVRNAILGVVSLSLSVSQGVSTVRYLQKGGIATAIPNPTLNPIQMVFQNQL